MAFGISTHGDVLVNQTADSVDLNDIWAEVQQVLELYNNERKSVADLLSYRTVNVVDAIPQSISSDSFEEATEFGVPRAIRPPSDVLKLGYSFKGWDISLRATWKFLREATAEQVQAQVTRVLEADNKLTNGFVLNRFFNPVTQQNEWGHTCYGLWSADGMIPPPYLGQTFDGRIRTEFVRRLAKYLPVGPQVLLFSLERVHPLLLAGPCVGRWRATTGR